MVKGNTSLYTLWGSTSLQQFVQCSAKLNEIMKTGCKLAGDCKTVSVFKMYSDEVTLLSCENC